jgi:hypothetical protein
MGLTICCRRGGESHESSSARVNFLCVGERIVKGGPVIIYEAGALTC